MENHNLWFVKFWLFSFFRTPPPKKKSWTFFCDRKKSELKIGYSFQRDAMCWPKLSEGAGTPHEWFANKFVSVPVPVRVVQIVIRISVSHPLTFRKAPKFWYPHVLIPIRYGREGWAEYLMWRWMAPQAKKNGFLRSNYKFCSAISRLQMRLIG